MRTSLPRPAPSLVRSLLLTAATLALLLGGAPSAPAARTAPTSSTTTRAVAVAVGPHTTMTRRGTAARSSSAYDDQVRADAPAAYFTLDGRATTDLTGHGHRLTYHGAPTTSFTPDGQRVAVFNGSTQYAEIADAADLSVSHTGSLTVEAWVRPDTLEFRGAETSGDGPLVHYLGKGVTRDASQEYSLRIYSRSASRPNRFSAYHFNPRGGLGSGSYFQGGLTSTDGGTPPLLKAGDWVHVAAVYDTAKLVSGYGTVRLYRNGVLMDHDSMRDYAIVPRDGSAPLRVGTRDLLSFFTGAIGRVAVYGHVVPQPRLAAHYSTMTRRVAASALR